MDKQKIFILVEGVHDTRFLIQFLKSHYTEIAVFPEKQTSEMVSENELYKVIIKQCNTENGSGWASILRKEIQEDIRQKDEEGFSCLLILDTDDPIKQPNQGGFENRVNLLENLKQEKELNFDYFLFPDNENDGDLETLLMQAILPDRKGVFDCITSYIDCLKSNLSDEQKLKIPENKNVIYEMFPQIFRNKTDILLFDYDNEVFSKLKDFLDRFLK